jgi:hypothetical protein
MSLNDFMKNLNYKIKAKEVGEASWGTRQKYKPMTMPSVDTLLSSGTQLNKQQNLRNEMVKKYIKEQEQPVQVTIDGEVRDFKFHQVEKPEFFDVEDEMNGYLHLRDKVAMERTETMIEAEHEIDDIVERINRWKRRKTLIDYHKNQLIANMKEIQDAGDGSRFAEWQESRAQYIQLDGQDDQSDENIQHLEHLLQTKKDGFAQIYRNYDMNEAQLEELKADIQNKEKQNSQKIKAYGEELQALNVGKLNTKQEPMESDEEYFERLTRLADLPYADGNTEEKARIEQKQELRDNFLSITRNQELINQVINGMDYENFIDIYELNKVFPIFKERFLKVYGVNNKNITAQDVIDFAYKIIQSPEPQIIKKEEAEGDFVVMENALLLFDKQGGEFYFKYLEGTHRFPVEREDGVRKIISKTDLLFYSLTGEEGSFKNINTPTTLKEILIAIGSQTLGEIGATINTTKKQFIGIMKSLQIEPTDIKPDYVGLEPEGMNQTEHHIVGVGMNSDPKNIPNKIHFGDNVINLKKLFLKNILSLTTPKGAQIFGIKNTPVSDNFVKVIFDIVNGKDLLSKDLGSLNNNEKIFLETILTASGLHKKHNTGGKTQSIEKVKHDYKIIIGEIESGNNGSEIKKRLNETLLTLSHLGVISNGQARKQYKDIISNYF